MALSEKKNTSLRLNYRERQNPKCSLSFYPKSEFFYPNSFSRLLMESYGELGAFAHRYVNREGPEILPNSCNSYIQKSEIINRITSHYHGVRTVEIDNEGKHIASVTVGGCLTVHDFESLYREAQEFRPGGGTERVDNTKKHKLHIHLRPSAVKWNPSDRHQVACASNQVLLYDVEGLQSIIRCFGNQARPAHLLGRYAFSDVAISSSGSMVAASDNMITLWDPRVSGQFIRELNPISESKPNDFIKSIQFDEQDQNVFAAGKNGIVYKWDIRNAAENFPSLPLATWEVPEKFKLEQIPGAGLFEIQRGGIYSIRFNPCCSSQLAFQMATGWTGILDTGDTRHFHMTHSYSVPLHRTHYYLKPSWLHACSVYAIPVSKGIRLLDFHHSPRSPWHVDNMAQAVNQNDTYRDVLCTQGIMACAAHPSYNAIVAGTERSSLMIISQRSTSFKKEYPKGALEEEEQ